MGKGDKKTYKGKLFKSSYGVKRPRKKKAVKKRTKFRTTQKVAVISSALKKAKSIASEEISFKNRNDGKQEKISSNLKNHHNLDNENNMKTLYIIGNGFDLHHGLKTEYSDFREYILKNHEDLLEAMSKYYDIEDDSLLWSEFENGLKEFDSTELEEIFGEHLPDISSDDFRDRDWYELERHIELELDPLKEELQGAFNEWISKRETPADIEKKKIELPTNAKYLNFNYTDVLETIYGITRENITYIHNRAGEEDDLLYGHAWKPEEWSNQREAVMPEGLTEEQKQDWIDEQADNYHLSIERGWVAIDSFFSSIYKNCQTNIRNHQSFFSNLKDIDKIYVLGHSLSEVDKEYFEEIVKGINKDNVEWIVSYYSLPEEQHHKTFIEGLGINPDKVKMIKMSELKGPN